MTIHQQEKERAVVLKAMGHAISKAVTVAEVLKHRVEGLHQITQISSIETVDVFEPLEEGLDRVENKRHIPGICIRLSLDPLDESDPGYQAPLPASQVSPPLVSVHSYRGDGEHKQSRRSRKSRGRKGDDQQDDANTDEEAATAEQEQDSEHGDGNGKVAVGRARGGKRGRAGRGSGRGSGGRGSGEAQAVNSHADSTNHVNGSPTPAAVIADGAEPDAQPSSAAAGGKKSSRSRRSGKKKAVGSSSTGDGDVSKEHDNGAGGNNDGNGGSEEPAHDDTRSRGRGGRGGRGRGRGVRGEPKSSSEVKEGPAAVAAD